MWHLTQDTWHLTTDMWHIVGGERSLKILAPKLLQFGIDSFLKIQNERTVHIFFYVLENFFLLTNIFKQDFCCIVFSGGAK